MSATLHLVCGLPGSGKTTLALQLEKKHSAVRLCPDEWMDSLGTGLGDEELRARIERLQWTVGLRLLTLGVPVIVEWGTWGADEREALRQDAARSGAETELYLLDPPLDVLWERVQRRGIESPAVTLDDLSRWSEAFQRPDAEELARYSRVHVV
jgi:predicted kinase